MRFNMICEAHGIEHRLTKPNHPWTNGQVEPDYHEQLRTHLSDFMAANNFGQKIKTLSGLTPYEYNLQNMDVRSRKIHHQSDLSKHGSKAPNSFDIALELALTVFTDTRAL